MTAIRTTTLECDGCGLESFTGVVNSGPRSGQAAQEIRQTMRGRGWRTRTIGTEFEHVLYPLVGSRKLDTCDLCRDLTDEELVRAVQERLR